MLHYQDDSNVHSLKKYYYDLNIWKTCTRYAINTELLISFLIWILKDINLEKMGNVP